jgi:hypothetical protein
MNKDRDFVEARFTKYEGGKILDCRFKILDVRCGTWKGMENRVRYLVPCTQYINSCLLAPGFFIFLPLPVHRAKRPERLALSSSTGLVEGLTIYCLYL